MNSRARLNSLIAHSKARLEIANQDAIAIRVASLFTSNKEDDYVATDLRFLKIILDELVVVSKKFSSHKFHRSIPAHFVSKNFEDTIDLILDLIENEKPVTASDDPKFVIKCPSNDSKSLSQVAHVLGNIDSGFEVSSSGNVTFFNIDANTDEMQKLRRVKWRHNIEVD